MKGLILKKRIHFGILGSLRFFSVTHTVLCTVGAEMLGNVIDSGMGLSITIDKLRVFINKTLSILSAYQ